MVLGAGGQPVAAGLVHGAVVEAVPSVYSGDGLRREVQECDGVGGVAVVLV